MKRILNFTIVAVLAFSFFFALSRTEQVNVYAQTLSEDEVDYLISRVNREFGEAI